MKVKEVLERREQGLAESLNIYHLWGIYAGKETAPFSGVQITGYHAVEGIGPNRTRALTIFGLTGAYPVALLYRGLSGSYARFDLIPQHQLLTGAWVYFPTVRPNLPPVKCPMKLYRKLKTGRCKEGRLTIRFYYCYQTNMIKPLKPDDWINRKLIDIAEERLKCPI